MIDVENLTIKKAKELGLKKIITENDLNSILNDKLVPKYVKDYYSAVLNYFWIIPDDLVKDYQKILKFMKLMEILRKLERMTWNLIKD